MKDLFAVLLVASATLGACAAPVASGDDGRAVVTDRADGGFNVTVRMTQYQAFPNRGAMHERCGLAAIDAVHSEAARRRIEGLRVDPAEVRTSTNRNSLLGTTNCTASIAVAPSGTAQDRAQFLAYRQANAPARSPGDDAVTGALLAVGAAASAAIPPPRPPPPMPVTCRGQRMGSFYTSTCQ